MVFMRGVSSEVVADEIDFLYLRETKVVQKNLEEFLNLVKELGITGLSNTPDENRKIVKEVPNQQLKPNC